MLCRLNKVSTCLYASFHVKSQDLALPCILDHDSIGPGTCCCILCPHRQVMNPMADDVGPFEMTNFMIMTKSTNQV